MVNIIRQLVPESKYSIKCPFAMTPTRLVVHNTANDATARNEIAYMTNNNYETSFHFAVDDVEIVQGLPLDRNGWHASDGNGPGNREGIAIEICYSKSGGDRFLKAEENAVDLIVYLLNMYGWGIDKVTKHQDYGNHKYCPHRTLDMGWDRFLNMIKAKLNPITSIEEIERKSVRLKIDANLWNLNFVNPDNAISVKQFKTGDVIDNIVAIAHHQSGCKYYLTEYSYSNNIMNGFNIVDCEDIVAEKPKEEPKEEEPIITPIPTPEPKPEEPEITENFIKRLIKAIIDFINKLLNK